MLVKTSLFPFVSVLDIQILALYYNTQRQVSLVTIHQYTAVKTFGHDSSGPPMSHGNKANVGRKDSLWPLDGNLDNTSNRNRLVFSSFSNINVMFSSLNGINHCLSYLFCSLSHQENISKRRKLVNISNSNNMLTK